MDKNMKKALTGAKFIPSKRQPPNLKRLLTRAKLEPPETEEGGSFRCGDKRCGTCKYNEIHEGNHIMITSTQKKFYIKSRMDCKSENVLYIITCNGCKEQYIGKTNDQLSSRMRVHRQQINTPKYRQLGMSKHIDECCSQEPKFTVAPFYKTTNDKSRTSVKEQYFINTLKPSLNRLSL